MNNLKRQVNEVVELTKDCELGAAHERAVVTEIHGKYMTLVFPGVPGGHGPHVEHTGADYRFVKSILSGLE